MLNKDERFNKLDLG